MCPLTWAIIVYSEIGMSVCLSSSVLGHLRLLLSLPILTVIVFSLAAITTITAWAVSCSQQAERTLICALTVMLYSRPCFFHSTHYQPTGTRHGEIVHKNFLHRHLPIEAYPVIKTRPVQRLTLGEAKHQCWGTGPSKASSPKLRSPRNRLLLSPASHASDHQS